MHLTHGNAKLLPLGFFAIACLVSSLGPGAIASVALIVWAPIAGVLATTGFGVLMAKRIRVEDRALGRVQ